MKLRKKTETPTKTATTQLKIKTKSKIFFNSIIGCILFERCHYVVVLIVVVVFIMVVVIVNKIYSTYILLYLLWLLLLLFFFYYRNKWSWYPNSASIRWNNHMSYCMIQRYSNFWLFLFINYNTITNSNCNHIRAE